MDKADTAWLLISTALVLLMTPALGFFYGGLVRSKNALNTLMMSVSSLGFVGVTWALLGYSIAFGPGSSLSGGLGRALLSGVGLEPQGTIPHILFMAFQGTFAIVTAALISGAIVERMRFGPYLAFITLWGLVVYAPVAHWVWGGGFLARLGALDFAGGTVVHVNAGAAALVAALVLGPRKDYARQAILPHNVPFTLLGAGLLWFGWFGFNGGSALASNGLASLAFVNTMFAPTATLVVWTLLDLARTGRRPPSAPRRRSSWAWSRSRPRRDWSVPFPRSCWAASRRFRATSRCCGGPGPAWTTRSTSWPPTALGGTVGALLTGVLAQKAWNGAADGALFGNPRQLAIQALSVLAVLAYSGAATFGLLKLVGAFAPLRAVGREEGIGLDVTQHGEEAYSRGEGAILVLPDVSPAGHSVPAAAPAEGGSG